MTLPELLASLGTTADEVAATLLAGGFRGVPGSACECPVARRLKNAFGFSIESVGDGCVYVREGDWEEDEDGYEDEVSTGHDLPKPVHDFIVMFDDGRYPELAEPGAAG